MAIGDIKAGRAYVEIGTDDTYLKQGLTRAQNRVQMFESGLKGAAIGMAALGAAAVAAGFKVAQFLTANLEAAIERASEFVDVADRLGADVVGLQKLSFAAGRMGIEFEQVNVAIKKLQKNLGEGTIDDELRKIGLHSSEIIGLKADEAFLRVVDALRSVSDQNQQAALTMKFLGRAGQDLQAIIKEGSASLLNMGTEGEKLGYVLNELAARDFESAGDSVDDMKKSIEGMFTNETSAKWIRVHADAITEFLTGNKAITQTFDRIRIAEDKALAGSKQRAIDRENAKAFAKAQAEEAKRLEQHAKSTAQYMADELAAMEALAPAMKKVGEEMKRNDELRQTAKRLFEGTRTPQERAAAERQQAKELNDKGFIDDDLYRRRMRQIQEDLARSLPEVMKSVSVGTAAGTFNPMAVRGLGENERLTKAAEQTEKNTKKIAESVSRGRVLV